MEIYRQLHRQLEEQIRHSVFKTVERSFHGRNDDVRKISAVIVRRQVACVEQNRLFNELRATLAVVASPVSHTGANLPVSAHFHLHREIATRGDRAAHRRSRSPRVASASAFLSVVGDSFLMK